MLTLIKNSLNPKNETNWFWGIALAAIFIEMCFHALLPISVSNDSYGYLHLAKNLGSSSAAFERTLGYPILLALSGARIFDNLIPIVLIQAVVAVTIPLIIFKCLVRYGLGYAVLGALIACAYFYNFVTSLYILTEPVYVFATAVYVFCLVRYFHESTLKNLIWVIAACWLIALIRVSGTMHFLSLLAGMGFVVLTNLFTKNIDGAKMGLKHIAAALLIFLVVSLFQSLVTNRTSSVVWPHFVFNWAYRDSVDSETYLGVIKPENGPATKKLFEEIEKIVIEVPSQFDILKSGGSPKVESLKPQKNGKYSKEAAKLLIDDLINNSRHPLKSWWIEAVLMGNSHDHGHGIVGSSKLLGDAVKEGFRAHPEKLWQRLKLILEKRLWISFIDGIEGHIISFPSAYYMQVPKKVDVAPSPSIGVNSYKQWTHDLYKHTGIAPENRTVEYAQLYPTTIAGALENVRTDNLVGFGHYIALQGTQILRLCWILIAVGIIIFPFARNKPILASLICASIIPNMVAVFTSETDARHLIMSSPIHIVTAVIVLYTMCGLWRRPKVSVEQRNAE